MALAKPMCSAPVMDKGSVQVKDARPWCRVLEVPHRNQQVHSRWRHSPTRPPPCTTYHFDPLIRARTPARYRRDPLTSPPACWEQLFAKRSRRSQGPCPPPSCHLGRPPPLRRGCVATPDCRAPLEDPVSRLDQPSLRPMGSLPETSTHGHRDQKNGSLAPMLERITTRPEDSPFLYPYLSPLRNLISCRPDV